MPQKPRPGGPPPHLSELLRGARLTEPPDGVFRRAVAAAAELASAGPSAWQWVVSLVFDSAAEPLPAGVRRAGGEERRLLYDAGLPQASAEPRRFDLRLRREPGGALELTGQVAPASPGSVVEVTSGRARRRARLGPTGEFLLRGLRATARELSLRLDDPGAGSILLEGVPLPEADED